MPRRPQTLPAHGAPPRADAIAPATRAARGRVRKALGLQGRLLRSTAVSVGLFMLLACALGYTIAQDHSLRSSRTSIDALADAVVGSVASAAAANDQKAIEQAIAALAAHPLVGRAQWLAADGQVRASAQRHAGQEALSLPVQRELPGAAAARPATQLVIIPDDQALRAIARAAGLAVAGFVAVQALIVALLCHLVTMRGVSQPIVALARRLHAISPGTDERLPSLRGHGRDEIGMLIATANALLDTAAQALGRERRLQSDMADIEARYRKIFESSSAGIFVLDPRGKLVASNPTVTRLSGLGGASLQGTGEEGFIDCVFADPRRVREMIRLSRQRREAASGDLELRQHGPTTRWVHCLLSVHDGEDGLVEGVMYDITDRKSVEHTAMYHSQHDALTGLKNRAGTLARLQRRTRTALAEQRPLTLLVIDLDGFKAVNDRHGHHAGDQVLVACAQRLRSVVGRGGPAVIGRLGGDEFMVVLERLSLDDPMLTALCKALLDALGETVTLDDGRTVSVGASIGVAALGQHGRDAQTLTEAADQAMYAVKSHGKDSFALAWSGMPMAPAVATPLDAALAAQPMFADSLPMEALPHLARRELRAGSFSKH